MAQFKYTISTGSQIHLSGIITADSEEAARKNLLKLGYTVIAVDPVSTTPAPTQGKKNFSFEARDKNNKKIIGTVTAADEQTARNKLEQEYQLSIGVLKQLEEEKPDLLPDQELIIQEARLVVEKAEEVLRKITPYDLDYNHIFDMQDEMRTLLRNQNYSELKNKTASMLAMLQEKEKTTIILEKEEVVDTVLQQFEDMRSEVKSEAENLAKDKGNYFFNLVLEEIAVLSRWLLIFYAIFLVTAELVAQKKLTLFASEFLQKTIDSPLLFQIALAVVLVQVYSLIKLRFLKKQLVGSILLGVLTIVLISWTFLIKI